MRIVKNATLEAVLLSVVFEKDDTLGAFKHSMLAELGSLPHGNGFVMFLGEIVKNIFDHASGRGFVSLCLIADEIKFDICDFGKKKYDLAEVKTGGSTKTGETGPCGNGLCGGMIEDYALGLGIHLSIDTDRGFRYTGYWVHTEA